MSISCICAIFLFFMGLSLHENKLLSAIIAKLNTFIIYLLLPMTIISSMNSFCFHEIELFIPVVAVLWTSLMAAIIIIFYHIKSSDRLKAGSNIIMFCTAEGGSLGLIYALLVFDKNTLGMFFLYDFTIALLLFSFVNFLASGYGQLKNYQSKSLFEFLISPMMLSMLIGILLNLMHYQLPAMLIKILDSSEYLILPVVSLMLGYYLDFKVIYLRNALYYSTNRLIISLIIALICILIFAHHQYNIQLLIILMAILPPSFISLSFSEEYGLDTKMIANTISISTLISILCFISVYVFIL